MVNEAFGLHPLTPGERATCASMLSRESSGRLLAMPTHHFGEYGDLTGFRYDCSGTAAGSCLPVSRRMFYGHTMVECAEGEAEILKLMSQQQENKRVMKAFLEDTDRACSPALLDCVPDNTDALTGHGVQQVKKKTHLFIQYKKKKNF